MLQFIFITCSNAQAPESAAFSKISEEAQFLSRYTLGSYSNVCLASLLACAWEWDPTCYMKNIYKEKHANKHAALNEELFVKATHSLPAVRSLKRKHTLFFF